MQRNAYEYKRQDPRTERQVWEAVEEFLRERYDERDAQVTPMQYLIEQDE